MRRLVIALILLSLTAPIFGAQAQAGAFEPTPCPRSMPYNVTCGSLTVPEDRSDPASRTITIAAAIYHTGSRLPAEPILFLDGGPGSRTLDAWSHGVDPLVILAGRSRDVVIFDQRGMGYSDPALTCPEQGDADNANWLIECRDRLTAGGVQLDAYTTRENAADAADLMRALGFKSYNVWGGSYGSSLALALLRDHPEGIRSIFLSALQPPDLQASLVPGLLRTIDLLDAQCAADAACSAAFPGSLRQKLVAIVTRLDAAPVSMDVDGAVQTLTSASVISGLGQLLKDTYGLANAPALIEALYAEQYDLVIPYAAALAPSADYFKTNPTGAYYSMRCTDSALATSPAAMNAALALVDPVIAEYARQTTASLIADCETWGAHVPTDAEKALPVSDVPVLIMNGEFDPYSSPEAVAEVLATLPDGQSYWVRGYGHGFNQDSCAQHIYGAFTDDPTAPLDTSCLETIAPLHFVIPAT